MVAPQYHHFIDDTWYWYVPREDVWIDMTDVAFEKIVLENPTIKKIYNTDIIHDIQAHQWEDVLFMVGVSYHILHDEELEEWETGGHVILVSKINTSGNVVIFDPWQPLLLYYEVDQQKFVNAVKDMGEYTFMKIEYNGGSEI
jgi:hypothetical protein